MDKTKLRELLADYYKKRDAISQEIDSMTADPREKKTKRYTKLIFSQDLLTKRIIELSSRLGEDKDKDNDKMRDLLSLVDWAHKHVEEKKQLITMKHFPSGDKRSLKLEKIFPESAEKELEDLLEKRRRIIMVTNAHSEEKNGKHNQQQRQGQLKRQRKPTKRRKEARARR